MQLLSNPWFIIFTIINIIATVYLAFKIYHRTKEEPPLFERLRNSSIFTAKKSVNENKPKKIKQKTLNP